MHMRGVPGDITLANAHPTSQVMVVLASAHLQFAWQNACRTGFEGFALRCRVPPLEISQAEAPPLHAETMARRMRVDVHLA